METKLVRNGIFVPLFLLIFTGCAIPFETATSSRIHARIEYTNPAWAPPYHSGVRYYYFPDIEVYYDLSANEYVYLNDGRWYFSNSLPDYYSEYDLYRGFVVSLNINVFQPWRHHQYYVSNYPRYYYRSYYRQHNDHDWIRGFNENDRHEIYRYGYRKGNPDKGGRVNFPGTDRDDNRTYHRDRGGNQNDRGTNYGERNGNQNDRTSYGENNNGTRNGNGETRPATNDSRTTRYDNTTTPTQNQGRPEVVNQPSTNNPPKESGNGGRSSNYTREPQESNYYGKRIGQPVKVERQMREPKEPKSENKSEGRSSGGRR